MFIEALSKLKNNGHENFKYKLLFEFDCLYEWFITIYFWATEGRDPYNYPVYFLTPKNALPPSSFKFNSGLKQKFPSSFYPIDVSSVPLKNLLKFREDYFPLIINIETLNKIYDNEELRPSIGRHLKPFSILKLLFFPNRNLTMFSDLRILHVFWSSRKPEWTNRGWTKWPADRRDDT